MNRSKSYCAPEFRSLVDGTFNVPPGLKEILPPPSDAWSISPELGVVLFRLVTEHHKSRVLEFGAGSSSVVLAAALAQAGGGKLTSIEEDPTWCAERWDGVQRTAVLDAELIASRPEPAFGSAGPSYTYRSAASRIDARGPYDLVLIDAPQYYYGRDGALHLSYMHLPVGAFIVLDDARRSGEWWSIRRWLRTYRGLELRLYDPAFGGKGIAILQVARPLRPHLDALAIVSSSYHAVEQWWKRRKRRKRAMDDTTHARGVAAGE